MDKVTYIWIFLDPPQTGLILGVIIIVYTKGGQRAGRIGLWVAHL